MSNHRANFKKKTCAGDRTVLCTLLISAHPTNWLRKISATSYRCQCRGMSQDRLGCCCRNNDTGGYQRKSCGNGALQLPYLPCWFLNTIEIYSLCSHHLKVALLMFALQKTRDAIMCNIVVCWLHSCNSNCNCKNKWRILLELSSTLSYQCNTAKGIIF